MTRQLASLPLLPTAVIGSYPVPEWLERLKTDYYRNRISRTHLAELHDTAIKAALKDQEKAGIDIVSDGELCRDDDIDYLLTRIAGAQIQAPINPFYYQLIAHRIRRAPDTVPADKLPVNPDCGLRHVPADVARAKLCAMVEGVAEVRRTLSAPVTTSSATARPSDTRPQSPRTEVLVTCPELKRRARSLIP